MGKGKDTGSDGGKKIELNRQKWRDNFWVQHPMEEDRASHGQKNTFNYGGTVVQCFLALSPHSK